MAKIIELTKARSKNDKFLLNSDYILDVEQKEDYTIITIINEFTYLVAESIKELKEIING